MIIVKSIFKYIYLCLNKFDIDFNDTQLNRNGVIIAVTTLWGKFLDLFYKPDNCKILF